MGEFDEGSGAGEDAGGEDVFVPVGGDVSVDDDEPAGEVGGVVCVWVRVGVGEADADLLVCAVVGMVFDGPGTAARLLPAVLP